jgi:hypothetical protein
MKSSAEFRISLKKSAIKGIFLQMQVSARKETDDLIFNWMSRRKFIIAIEKPPSNHDFTGFVNANSNAGNPRLE